MTVTTVRWEQQQSRLHGGGKRQENGKKMRKEKRIREKVVEAINNSFQPERKF